MYQVGELIIYGSNGVCRVERIAPGEKDPRLFYTLSLLHQSCTVITPVDNPKIFTRPLISRAEAQALLDRAADLQAAPFYSRVPRELTDHYDALFKTYDCSVLLELIVSIARKGAALREQKKRLNSVDESYLRRAKDFLLGELGAVLDCTPEEIMAAIQEKCPNLHP